ncbi:hypothetical protein MesoLjLc_23570 [Mesorhizobium sp. L-8-10]|uniref:MarR family winged helix-turn-helix transcriptional regulator n=1 Tax=unclassified Mesorhizobium TaxID=325217 RepID=UPI0019255E89|nr:MULTISPECIES: MarR family transcriptional regulator [unclassified Mesorhizobium]BCH22625.1 hypothetical protein MesoLjLb_24100 [Mesorhizobium sp. L-8-3]BCH30427.1 hypothetical protein MesoLjLc_23570 [Mesorhizobium sp. L-8-10]
MSETTTRKAKSAKAAAEKVEPVKLGKLDSYIGFNLRLAQNASFKAFKRHTGDAELRPGWFAVLSLIHDNPGITPMALSKASGRDKSTLTPVLRDLLRLKLIARETVENDKRSYTLSLTRLGKDKLAMLAEHAAAHDRTLDEIVGDKKEELIRLLKRISALLD